MVEFSCYFFSSIKLEQACKKTKIQKLGGAIDRLKLLACKLYLLGSSYLMIWLISSRSIEVNKATIFGFSLEKHNLSIENHLLRITHPRSSFFLVQIYLPHNLIIPLDLSACLLDCLKLRYFFMALPLSFCSIVLPLPQ